jgi:hypothetical protein
VYCVSVLLSGMATLVFSDKEVKLMDQHYKVHLQRLLKLHQATPAPVVFFLAGCLPLPAQLHQRMFSLFGQLCRLRDGDNILALHARNILASSSPSSKSWFWKLRQLCLQYSLPHPLTWLDTRPSKLQVKAMVRPAVLQYWRGKLQSKADSLPSLCYLRTGFMFRMVHCQQICINQLLQQQVQDCGMLVVMVKRGDFSMLIKCSEQLFCSLLMNKL